MSQSSQLPFCFGIQLTLLVSPRGIRDCHLIGLCSRRSFRLLSRVCRPASCTLLLCTDAALRGLQAAHLHYQVAAIMLTLKHPIFLAAFAQALPSEDCTQHWLAHAARSEMQAELHPSLLLVNAVQWNHPEQAALVKALLDRKVPLEAVCPESGQTALHMAACQADAQVKCENVNVKCEDVKFENVKCEM